MCLRLLSLAEARAAKALIVEKLEKPLRFMSGEVPVFQRIAQKLQLGEGSGHPKTTSNFLVWISSGGVRWGQKVRYVPRTMKTNILVGYPAIFAGISWGAPEKFEEPNKVCVEHSHPKLIRCQMIEAFSLISVKVAPTSGNSTINVC